MSRPLRPTRRTLLLSALVAGTAAACSSAGGTSTGDTVTATSGSARGEVSSFWDATRLHTLEAELDPEEVSAMVQTYLDTGDKEWITGSATLDGTAFEQVGFKLKGNSSLRDISVDDDPATLPWRVRLDKFADGQTFEGAADLVVRSNTTPSALNEAVALDLLAEAGLASQLSVSTAFTVNDGDPVLRLTLEHLDDAWMASVFTAGGILYKSDAEGTWDYVDEDPASYTASFDVEAGEEDYTPLIAFLAFLADSDDEDFAAQLADHLEVEAFARYLALEDLMANTDDIDGPGNNSYLYYGSEAETMTVVAWDHNLAFGAQNDGGMPGGGEMPEDGQRPEGGRMPESGQMPDGGDMPEGGGTPGGAAPSDGGGEAPTASDGGGEGGPGGGTGGGGMGGNVLATRFTGNTDFAALVEEQASALRTDLVDSGLAADLLAARASVLTEQAGELISSEDVTTDSEQITAVLAGDAGTGTGGAPAASDGGS